MKIIVDHIYGKIIKKMFDGGWKVYDDPNDDPKDRPWMRRISGCDMVKDFESIGAAIKDFEKITGFDAIGDEDQCGCPVFTFKCLELKIAVAGWECGRHLYCKWDSTPRKVLEILNS